MSYDLVINLAGLFLAAGIPTATFIFNFGKLNSRVELIEKENERFQNEVRDDIREMRDKFDKLMFYLMSSRPPVSRTRASKKTS